MNRMTAVLLSSIVLLGALAVPALARGKKAPTAPGKYTVWGEDIDQLEILETFDANDYSRVIVEQFDGSATPLPEEDDNTYAPVKQVLADTATSFVAGFQATEGRTLQASLATGESPMAGSLLIRGKVVTMDPGSRAARYWGGFGAGAAAVEIAGEVVDAESGRVLLRFTQARRSGFGIGGGDYVSLLNRNLRQIGEDVAGILAAF